MTTISASATFQVPGGPTLAVSTSIAAEAYDKVEVVLNPGDTGKEVDIQPGAAAQVRLLVIKSSLYGAGISYVASDGTTDSAEVVLDGPHMFVGAGILGLFGTDPKILKFSNSSTAADKKAQVEVLVGRAALRVP